MNPVFLTSVAVTVWETVSAFVPRWLLMQEAVAQLVSVSTGERQPSAVSIALEGHTEKRCSVCLGTWGRKKSRILVSQHVCDLIGSCLQELENKSFPMSETWRFSWFCFSFCPSCVL